MKNNTPIAITCGDPAGIGPEIIIKWTKSFRDLTKQYIYIGPKKWLEQLSVKNSKQLYCVGPANFKLTPGNPSLDGAKIAYEALEIAAYGCLTGDYSGVVTSPISKIWMHRAGFNFPGQTEFFAKIWKGTPTMGFMGKRMRIVLGTWHIPLIQVPYFINPSCVERAVSGAFTLSKICGFKNPKIGVCGLNPHAGEDSLLGKEEKNIINPTLDYLRAHKWPNLLPCFSADTLFWRHWNGEFNCIVAWYHDQGLIPIKTFEFESAVHVTLGLNCIRTSPSYGTAFKLAGSGKAQIGSFARAVEVIQKWKNL